MILTLAAGLVLAAGFILALHQPFSPPQTKETVPPAPTETPSWPASATDRAKKAHQQLARAQYLWKNKERESMLREAVTLLEDTTAMLETLPQEKTLKAKAAVLKAKVKEEVLNRTTVLKRELLRARETNDTSALRQVEKRLTALSGS